MAENSLQVLLVEDNILNQKIAESLLARCGANVTVAVNGAEAVERVGERAFDLVLMDLQMPVMDGLEATRRIRRLPAGAKLPVIAMSAAEEEERQACFEAGMDDFLAKPISVDALGGMLARWGGGRI